MGPRMTAQTTARIAPEDRGVQEQPSPADLAWPGNGGRATPAMTSRTIVTYPTSAQDGTPGISPSTTSDQAQKLSPNAQHASPNPSNTHERRARFAG